MKRILPAYTLVGLALCLLSTSCRKSLSYDSDTTAAQASTGSNRPARNALDSVVKPLIPYPQTAATGCTYTPNYGDTILYPQNISQDYIVSPVNTPPSGKFFSWPQGMIIDSLTGAINVTKSETGLRYAIGYVKNGTTDTCLTSLIIGGAAYLDSVYVLDQGALTAQPYYDANTFLSSVCAGNGCTFDVNNNAANQRIIIDKLTGIIDLQKTLNGSGLLGGAFGLLPLNGMTVPSTIYYRLNDASNSALQHIDVELVYYYSKSQIGTGLLGSILSKLTNALSGNMVSTAANPRPPLIVIVRHP